MDFYRFSVAAEIYLDTHQTIDAKINYARFRISNHPLAVETQRYCSPVIP